VSIGVGPLPEPEEMQTTAPLRRAFMYGSTARDIFMVEKTLQWIMSSMALSENSISSIGISLAVPTLLTSSPRPPSASISLHLASNKA
jgi:hypothetical protein